MLYYEDDDVLLYHGDCREILPRLEAHHADLIFADPPYNLSNGGFTCHAGRRVPVHKGNWDRSEGVEADHQFHREWLAACQHALKPSGTIWVPGTQHAIFSVGYAMQELGYHLLNTITWYKPNAPPHLACRMFAHATELLIWAAPRRSRKLLHTFDYALMKAWNHGKQMRDIWEITTPPGREKFNGKHPTQKPLALLERIVLASSQKGDLVLDPFNGSGTTGVAARMTGRRYIGIEIEEAYLKLTVRRLRALRGGDFPPLFDFRATFGASQE